MQSMVLAQSANEGSGGAFTEVGFQLGNPNTDLSRGDFGSIARTVANPRITQFALKVIF